MNYTISVSQIDKMKHAIGFRNDRIKGRKYRRYEAYRNCYATREGCNDFSELEDLERQGLMTSNVYKNNNWSFHVTQDGIKFLSEITGVKITESEE